MQSQYYFWWIERTVGGQWYGWKLLPDDEVWRFEYDLQRGTPDIRAMHRWMWDGQAWQYDPRSASALYYQSGERRLAT